MGSTSARRRSTKSTARRCWTLTRRASPAMAEALLEVLRLAYPSPAHATETAASGGVRLDLVGPRSPASPRPGWKRQRLAALRDGDSSIAQRTLSIGRRWRIVGPGVSPKPSSRITLRLGAGMAFGTGEHATTRLCLRMLEGLPPKGALLDVGAGSGILALAAWKLGFRPVTAIELDPAAVRVARANAMENGCARGIRWQCADLARWRPRQPQRVILANLLSGLLTTHAARLASWLTSDGELVVSGVLGRQRREVEAAFAKAGLKTVARAAQGRWRILRLNRFAATVRRLAGRGCARGRGDSPA